MGNEDMLAELARLRLENEALKERNRSSSRMTFKVSDKGGVSVYGLGRFPVTLYKEQWLKLLACVEELRLFIKHNEEKLTVKP